MAKKAARAQCGDKIEVIHQSFDDDDRALAEGDTRGAAKLILHRGRILGVGIAGAHAGDLLQPWTLAMTAGVKLRSIASMIAPYPTRGEINKKLASSHFTPLLFSGKSRALVAPAEAFWMTRLSRHAVGRHPNLECRKRSTVDAGGAQNRDPERASRRKSSWWMAARPALAPYRRSVRLPHLRRGVTGAHSYAPAAQPLAWSGF